MKQPSGQSLISFDLSKQNHRLILLLCCAMVIIATLLAFPFREITGEMALPFLEIVPSKKNEIQTNQAAIPFLRSVEQALAKIKKQRPDEITDYMSHVQYGDPMVFVTVSEAASVDVTEVYDEIQRELQQDGVSARVSRVTAPKITNKAFPSIFVSLPDRGTAAHSRMVREIISAVKGQSLVDDAYQYGARPGAPENARIRLNGAPGVALSTFAKAGADNFRFKDQLTDVLTRLQQRIPGMSYTIMDDGTDLFQDVLSLGIMGGIGVLVIFLLLWLLLFGNPWRCVEMGLAVIVPFGAGLLGLRLGGIAIGMAAVLGLIWSGVYILAATTVRFAFGHRLLSRRDKIAWPIVFAAIAAILMVFPTATMPGIFGSVFKSTFFSCAIPIALSTLFLLVWPIDSAIRSNSRWIGGYSRLILFLRQHLSLRLLAWGLPLFVVAYAIVFAVFQWGDFRFYPELNVHRYRVNIDCSFVSNDTTAIEVERELLKMTPVDEVFTVDGIEKKTTYATFIPGVSQLIVRLREDVSASPMEAFLKQKKRTSACDIQWAAESVAPSENAGNETVTIAGGMLDDRVSAAEMLKDRLQTENGEFDAHWRDIPQYLLLLNGVEALQITVDGVNTPEDDTSIKKAVAAVQVDNKAVRIEYNDKTEDESEAEIAHALSWSVGLALILTLVIHVGLAIRYRSLAPVLALPMPCFIMAAGFLFTDTIYILANFLAAPALMMPGPLFAFVHAFAVRKSSQHDDATERNDSNAGDLVPYLSGFLMFVAITTLVLATMFYSFLIPVAMAMLGGIIIVAYFVTILLPSGKAS